MARKKGGMSDARLALLNMLQREGFKRVPPSRRALFLPHCLRKASRCRGENTADGLVCRQCTPECAINRLSSHARSRGYRVFVVPGGEMVFNIIERHKPEAVVGVACRHELAQAAERLTGGGSGAGLAYQGVALSKSGCVDTEVDAEAVMAILNLDASSEPVRVEPVLSPVRQRRRWAGFATGAAAAVALSLALLLLLPSLAPILRGPQGGAGWETGTSVLIPEQPTVRYVQDQEGHPAAEVSAALVNVGSLPIASGKLRVTALFTGRSFLPSDGGVRETPLNGTLWPGERVAVEATVRVHEHNDTSILVELVVDGRALASRYIRSPMPVFISEARLSDYVVSVPLGRMANVTVEVFNELPVRPVGSLTLTVRSLSSFGKVWDSAEVSLQYPLGLNQTWALSLGVDVNDLDPGQPSFVAELYEGEASAPLDTAMFQG
ncbi:MAG: DUF116 domain-containing protein [Thermoplasmatota archaeon]